MQLHAELKAIISTMAAHLAKQRGQSMVNRLGGVCAYRGVSGRRCAVGCLIPDEIYDRDIEGGVHRLFQDDDEHHATVGKYLMALAPPGMRTEAVCSFFTRTQLWHDGMDIEQAGYRRTLAAAPDGATDEELAALIEHDLTAYMTEYSPEEWLTCAT